MNVAATKIYPIFVSVFFLANLVLSSLGQFIVPPHTHETGSSTNPTSSQEQWAFRTPHQHWVMVDQYGSMAWYSVSTETFSERAVTAKVERQEFSGELSSILPGGRQTVKCEEKSSFSRYCSPQKFLLSLQSAVNQIEPISFVSLNAGFIPSIDHVPIEV